MRIALLAWEAEEGILVSHVGRHITALALALRNLGAEIHLFVRSSSSRESFHPETNLTIHPVGNPRENDFIGGIQQLCREMTGRFTQQHRETPFSLIHAHDWVTANAAVWSKEETGIPFVFTLHSIEESRNEGMTLTSEQKRIADHEKNGCNHANHIIAVSHSLKEEIRSRYTPPSGHITVIYNGVDLARYERSFDAGPVKRQYGFAPLEPMILFSGQMEYRLGPDLLIEAMPEVHRRHPEAWLLFCGHGPMRQTLETRSAHLRLNHRIRFTNDFDSSSQLRLMQASDLVAIPSRNDPFSTVTLDAWGAGKPVVASRSGGPGEYIWNEVNGLLADNTPTSLAGELCRIMDDWERARWMGTNGRTAAESAFRWTQAGEQTLSVYSEQLGLS